MAKRSALSEDFIDDLFDDGLFDAGDNTTPQKLKLSEVEPNKNQPRKVFDEEALNELAQSIAEIGIAQPLLVRPYGDSYQIVAGERRWRAAKIAGLKEVPVRIMELTDEQAMRIALIENLQREDLNPIEIAMGYKQLIDTFSMTQEAVAKTVGKPRSSIANSLRLLTLPDDLRDKVSTGELSVGHCKVILGITDEALQRTLAEKCIKEEISVRSLEKLAKQMTATKQAREKAQKETFLVEAELSLTEHIGKPVRIEKSRDRYIFCIDCANEDELKELINALSELKK